MRRARKNPSGGDFEMTLATVTNPDTRAVQASPKVAHAIAGLTAMHEFGELPYAIASQSSHALGCVAAAIDNRSLLPALSDENLREARYLLGAVSTAIANSTVGADATAPIWGTLIDRATRAVKHIAGNDLRGGRDLLLLAADSAASLYEIERTAGRILHNRPDARELYGAPRGEVVLPNFRGR